MGKVQKLWEGTGKGRRELKKGGDRKSHGKKERVGSATTCRKKKKPQKKKKKKRKGNPFPRGVENDGSLFETRIMLARPQKRVGGLHKQGGNAREKKRRCGGTKRECGGGPAERKYQAHKELRIINEESTVRASIP